MIEAFRNSKFAIQTLLTMVLFFNAVAPLSIVITQFYSVDEASAESLFGDKILICTPSGYKYISFDEFEENSGKENNEQLSHCSLCLINTDSANYYLPDTHILNNLQITAAKDVYYILRYSLRLKTLHQVAQPRAPPSYLKV